MEAKTLVEALGLCKAAIDLLRGAKNLLPDSQEKEEATAALDRADNSFKIAEAQAAQDLGCDICECTWPPQIALRQTDGSVRCPACKRNVAEDYSEDIVTG